jgi:PAS domain S-box-containing protein
MERNMSTTVPVRGLRQTAFLSYGAALLSFTLALLVAEILKSQFRYEPYAVFICAMMFSAWYGGTKPGLLALVLSIFAFHSFFLGSILSPPSLREGPRLIVLTLTSLLAVMMSSKQRRAVIELRHVRDALELSVHELEQTNGSLQTENAERRRAEEDLRQARNSFRIVLDATPAMIHTARPDGELDYFNERWLTFVGLPLEAVQGWAWTATIHPDDVEHEVNRWRACVARGEPFECEVRMRRADGVYRWMLHRKVPMRDEHGAIVKWYGSGIDIEDRKQAEEAIKESEGRFRSLFENMVEGCMFCQMLYEDGKPKDYIYLEVNQAFKDMTGFRDIAGKKASEVVPDMKWPDPLILDHYGSVITTGQPERFEYNSSILKKCFLISAYSPKRDYFVAVFDNITDRKQAEEALKKSGARLRALFARIQSVREEERKKIAREIHDDLGATLTALKMDLQWLERNLDASDHRSNNILLDRAVAATELTNDAIQTVQRVARELRPSVLDRLGLVATIQFATREFQERTGIECVVQVPTEDVTATSEQSTALYRILKECLTNVIRHSGATRVEVRFTGDPNHLFMRVQDNGRGIESSAVGDTRSLGLHGMRERALALGGSISIDGAEGGGTVIAVRLPHFGGEASI